MPCSVRQHPWIALRQSHLTARRRDAAIHPRPRPGWLSIIGLTSAAVEFGRNDPRSEVGVLHTKPSKPRADLRPSLKWGRRCLPVILPGAWRRSMHRADTPICVHGCKAGACIIGQRELRRVDQPKCPPSKRLPRSSANALAGGHIGLATAPPEACEDPLLMSCTLLPTSTCGRWASEQGRRGQ